MNKYGDGCLIKPEVYNDDLFFTKLRNRYGLLGDRLSEKLMKDIGTSLPEDKQVKIGIEITVEIEDAIL